MSLLGLFIAIPEIFALYFIWRIWSSEDSLFFKISYSIIAIIPLLGPFLVLWISNMPSRQPPIMQDQQHRELDVTDRWRHVLEQKNPHTKFRIWLQMTRKNKDDAN